MPQAILIKINYKIKRLTGKIQRREAKFYKVVEEVNAVKTDKLPRLTSQQIKATEAITALKDEKEICCNKERQYPIK